MQVVADLHLHSKYSRAVSQHMIPSVMAQFGKQKGIKLLSTGDWTHPLWFRELKNYLVESEEGIYKIKDKGSETNDKEKDVRFLLSVEIANIFSQGGKGRRIHNLVFSPSFEVSEKINKELMQRGFNLSSDGRPIIGLSSKGLLELILEIDERCILIPCHVWTPWFGLYGQASGFDSLQESFGDLAKYVYGIETGLSSDPEMNWQIEELTNRSILSFSDAHSPAKMGREATVFELESLSYENIRKAIMYPSSRLLVHGSPAEASITQKNVSTVNSEQTNQLTNRVLYTIEFYPEEGKYHYSGHRNCNVTMTPQEQRVTRGICPVCHRMVTDGVMRRVQELADEESRIKNQELRVKTKKNSMGLQWFTDPKGIHPPYVKIVPLLEIVSEAIGSPVTSPKVKVIFDNLCEKLDGEFNVLLKAPIEEIKKISPSNAGQAEKVGEGIEKVRGGNIVIKPGYDGVFGVVKIWSEEGEKEQNKTEVLNEKEDKKKKDQLGLGI